MNFALGETQEAVALLASRVLDQGRPAGPAQAETYDCALWKGSDRPYLPSLALPGLAGRGWAGCWTPPPVLLTEVGSAGSAAGAKRWPASWPWGCCPSSRWGDRDLQQALLARGRGTGDTVLTAAPREPSDPMPARPATTATLAGGTGGAGTVSGLKVGVPCMARRPARILVPSASVASGGSAIVIVDPAADGGVRCGARTGSAGRPEYTLRLDEVPVTHILGNGAGGRVVRDLYQLAVAGACCLADGALSAALALTTAYVGSREQFGRPLATFQAVAQQIADIYVVARTLHLATVSACWRLETGREAAGDLDVAAYWLAEQAPAALRSCHHLHGGIGMDITCTPLHRYFAMVKDLVRFVGGADYRARPARRQGQRVGPLAMFLDLTGEQLRPAGRAAARLLRQRCMSPGERAAMLTERHGHGLPRGGPAGMGRGRLAVGVGWPAEYGGRGARTGRTANFRKRSGPRRCASARGDPADGRSDAAGPSHAAAEKPLPPADTRRRGAFRHWRHRAGGGHCSRRAADQRRAGWRHVHRERPEDIFTTGAHDADYIWLACRTCARNAPRHRGISILMVDTADPGFAWTPIITPDGAHHVNATYYADVRVPVTMRVGEENAGWRLVTTQLNHERVMLGPGRVPDCRTARPGSQVGRASRDPEAGRPPAAGPRRRTARAGPDLRVPAGQRAAQLAAVAAAPRVNIADASATKVFSSEHLQRLGQLLEDVVGRHGDPADEQTAELLRWLDVQAKRNIVLTFGGGVNEIQRELIATAGLGLPRVPR